MRDEARLRAEPTFSDGLKITIAAALIVASLFALISWFGAQSTLERVQYVFTGLGVGAIMPVTFLLSQLFLLPPRTKSLARRRRPRKPARAVARACD